VELAITGDVEGRVNVAQWTGSMTGQVVAQVARDGVDLGWIEADAALDGRLLTVDRLEGDLAGGAVRGWATVPLDEWTALRAALRLEGVAIADVAPELQQAEGALSGVLAAEPAESAHA